MSDHEVPKMYSASRSPVQSNPLVLWLSYCLLPAFLDLQNPLSLSTQHYLRSHRFHCIPNACHDSPSHGIAVQSVAIHGAAIHRAAIHNSVVYTVQQVTCDKSPQVKKAARDIKTKDTYSKIRYGYGKQDHQTK